MLRGYLVGLIHQLSRLISRSWTKHKTRMVFALQHVRRCFYLGFRRWTNPTPSYPCHLHEIYQKLSLYVTPVASLENPQFTPSCPVLNCWRKAHQRCHNPSTAAHLVPPLQHQLVGSGGCRTPPPPRPPYPWPHSPPPPGTTSPPPLHLSARVDRLLAPGNVDS
jgi:hypothetical protein